MNAGHGPGPDTSEYEAVLRHPLLALIPAGGPRPAIESMTLGVIPPKRRRHPLQGASRQLTVRSVELVAVYGDFAFPVVQLGEREEVLCLEGAQQAGTG